jgi:diaminopimelate decarboxylase
MSFEQLDEIAKEYGTPYYLMDGERYLKNVRAFQKAFKSRYDNLIVGYSFKTNYVPALCKIAKDAGCYAEVVSDMEYALAKRIGFEHIIFNGPIKKDCSLFAALEDKAVINLDSYYEVESVLRYKKSNPSTEVSVGLRLNINLTDEDGVSKVQCGLRVGRFGFSFPIFGEVVSKLRKNGIKIISLHGHTSSSDRAVANYRLIASQMLNVCERYDLNDLQYFDVGGGFFGAPAKGLDVSNKPKYSDYANCIMDTCLANDWFEQVRPAIVIEPGVSVVANVFSYVSKIFQVKDIAEQKFLTTDGTVFDVMPTFHGKNLPHTFYTQEVCHNTYIANIVGSTCMEKDVIMNGVEVPEGISYGDYIKIDGVGAYTIVLTPTFINFVSPIIGFKNNINYLVRRRQTIDDVLTLYK